MLPLSGSYLIDSKSLIGSLIRTHKLVIYMRVCARQNSTSHRRTFWGQSKFPICEVYL